MLSVQGTTLSIGAVKLPSGDLSVPQSVDLAGEAGIVRVHILSNGKVVLNPSSDTWLHLADVEVSVSGFESSIVGTETVQSERQEWLVRGESESDTIVLQDGEFIAFVGHDYSPFYPLLGSDDGVIGWDAVNPAPKAGEAYVVTVMGEIIKDVEEKTPLFNVQIINQYEVK